MGTNPDKLKELCEYWTDEYDWFTDQDYLNSFNQINFLKYQIQILSDINWDHFQTIKNSKKNPRKQKAFKFSF